MNETTAQPEPTPVAEAPPKPTLESLYDEYNVGVTEIPPAAEPIAEPEPATNDIAAIRSELAQNRKERAADKAEREQRATEADLKTAIATLGKDAGIEGKDSLLRGFLVAKATEDQRLRTLWESRNSNPKGWKAALKILADEVKDEFAMPNPQIEENQRALDESQRNQSTAAPGEPDKVQRVMSMPDGEFSQFWGRLAGRG